jgi:acetyl esterase/lipase
VGVLRAIVEPMEIAYGSAGGETLLLDAYPAAEGSAAVVVIHGGGWSGGDKRADLPFIQALSAAGLSVFSINYRLAPKHAWPACMEDVRAAIEWVQGHAHGAGGGLVSLGVVGYSAGGHLAATAGVTVPGVKATALLAGPTDLVLDNFRRGGLSPSMVGLLRGVAPTTRKGVPLEVPTVGELEALWGISPINALTSKAPPFYLVHGTADASVPYVQAGHWKKRCSDLGVACELVTLEGKTHHIAEWKGYEEGLAGWLKRAL